MVLRLKCGLRVVCRFDEMGFHRLGSPAIRLHQMPKVLINTGPLVHEDSNYANRLLHLMSLLGTDYYTPPRKVAVTMSDQTPPQARPSKTMSSRLMTMKVPLPIFPVRLLLAFLIKLVLSSSCNVLQLQFLPCHNRKPPPQMLLHPNARKSPLLRLRQRPFLLIYS